MDTFEFDPNATVKAVTEVNPTPEMRAAAQKAAAIKSNAPKYLTAPDSWLRPAEDIGAGVVSGINKGMAAIPGIPGDIESLGRMAMSALAPQGSVNQNTVLPTSADTIGAYERMAGRLPTAQSAPGRITDMAAQFVTPQAGLTRVPGLIRNFMRGVSGAPASVMPATLPTLTRVGLPAVAGGTVAGGMNELDVPGGAPVGAGLNVLLAFAAGHPGVAGSLLRQAWEKATPEQQAAMLPRLRAVQQIAPNMGAPGQTSLLSPFEATGSQAAVDAFGNIAGHPFGRSAAETALQGRGQAAGNAIGDIYQQGTGLNPNAAADVNTAGNQIGEAARSGLNQPSRLARAEAEPHIDQMRQTPVPDSLYNQVIPELEIKAQPQGDIPIEKERVAGNALNTLTKTVETPVPHYQQVQWVQDPATGVVYPVGGDVVKTSETRVGAAPHLEDLWTRLQDLKARIIDPKTGEAKVMTPKERQAYEALAADIQGQPPGVLTMLKDAMSRFDPDFARVRDIYERQFRPQFQAMSDSPAQDLVTAGGQAKTGADAYSAARGVARGTQNAPGSPAGVAELNRVANAAETGGPQAFNQFANTEAASELTQAGKPVPGTSETNRGLGRNFFNEDEAQAAISRALFENASRNHAAAQGLTGPAADAFVNRNLATYDASRDALRRSGALNLAGSRTTPMATTQHVAETSLGPELLEAGRHMALTGGNPHAAGVSMLGNVADIAKRMLLQRGYRMATEAGFAHDPQVMMNLMQHPTGAYTMATLPTITAQARGGHIRRKVFAPVDDLPDLGE